VAGKIMKTKTADQGHSMLDLVHSCTNETVKI